jgi:uncharacterized protein (DUF58 family)
MSNPRITVQTETLLKTRSWAKTLQLKPRRFSYLDGSNRVKRGGNGMEYFDNRPYQSGDDVRHIDWRLSARHTQAYLKIFQEERQIPVRIFCDLSSSLGFASQGVWKRVLAAEVAAACAWMAINQGDSLAAFVYRHPEAQSLLKHRRGEQAVLKLIDNLVKFGQPTTEKNQTLAFLFNEALALTLQQFARQGQPLLLISDFHAVDFWFQQLPILAKQSQVIILKINDILEEELPPPGTYILEIGNKRHFLSLRNKSERLFFQEKLIEQRQKWQNFCQQWQIHNLTLKTTDVLSQVLPQYFLPRSRSAMGINRLHAT